jgi:hypothetical protein
MNSQPPKSPKKTPIEQLDEETQREIAREGGPRAVTESVGHGFNADNPPGHPDNHNDIPAPSTGHKWDEPGESQHRLNPEDQAEPLEHAGATDESQPADDEDQMVKGRPPLKELAQLGGDEQGDAEDQDEDYQPRDEITPG